MCMYSLKAKVVVPEKERDILEQITWRLDKQENETLPQVELNSLEVREREEGRRRGRER